MDPIRIRDKKGPEKHVQEAVEGMLRQKGWYVLRSHGSMFSSGWPDDFACHSMYGQRWIEIKLPEMRGSKFTPAQLECFPKFIANGSGVWVLTAATDVEYKKLFKPSNFWMYLNTWNGRT